LKKVLFIVYSLRTVIYNPFHGGLVRYILVFRTLTTSSSKVYNFTTSGRTYRPLRYILYALYIHKFIYSIHTLLYILFIYFYCNKNVTDSHP